MGVIDVARREGGGEREREREREGGGGTARDKTNIRMKEIREDKK